eukprot:s574_g15.t1
MVRYFIERCVVFNRRRVDVKTVLRDTLVHAVQNDDPATVQAMLTAAVDPNGAADYRFKVDANLWDDWTALMHAACTAPRIVKKLLEAAADVNREDQDGATALMGAAKEDDLEAVRLLEEARADINVWNKDAETPLFYAGCNGNFTMVRYFIERGVVRYCHKENVVLRDTLIDAVQNYDFASVQAMLTAAIDPNAAAGTRFKVDVNGYDDNYWTMRAACTAPHMIKTLLDAAADVNEANENGATALLGAAEYRNPEAVTLLVEARADINVATDDAETPLLNAVRNGDFTMVRYFIERDARVNQCTVDGGTVLHIAAEENQLDLVQLLLTGRADLQIRNSTGETALDVARRRCSDEAQELLEISACVARRPGSERKRKLQLHRDLE